VNWFWKSKPKRIQVIRRDPTKLRLQEWREDPSLCSLAAKVLADPNLQLMLQVLANEHPLRTALPYGVLLDDRAVLQSRAEGYEMFLSNLEALGQTTLPVPMPDAVYEPM
jgi:hypothetical protein